MWMHLWQPVKMSNFQSIYDSKVNFLFSSMYLVENNRNILKGFFRVRKVDVSGVTMLRQQKRKETDTRSQWSLANWPLTKCEDLLIDRVKQITCFSPLVYYKRTIIGTMMNSKLSTTKLSAHHTHKAKKHQQKHAKTRTCTLTTNNHIVPNVMTE